jgi:hypothetical protein
MGRLAAACLFIASALLLAIPAHAGEGSPAPEPSPETVVQVYMDAMKEGRYKDMAGVMHPDALETFGGMLRPLLEAGLQEEGEDAEMFRAFKGLTPEARKKLTPAELFGGFLEGLAQVAPGMREAMGSATVKPLGSVTEGDMVHVVCRSSFSMQEIAMSSVQVISLKKSEGAWRVLLTGAMEGMAQAIQEMMKGIAATEAGGEADE